MKIKSLLFAFNLAEEKAFFTDEKGVPLREYLEAIFSSLLSSNALGIFALQK